jgi:hypothetical protein
MRIKVDPCLAPMWFHDRVRKMLVVVFVKIKKDCSMCIEVN